MSTHGSSPTGNPANSKLFEIGNQTYAPLQAVTVGPGGYWVLACKCDTNGAVTSPATAYLVWKPNDA